MSTPRFNWEDARYFLAVARAGQIGKAAESLGFLPLPFPVIYPICSRVPNPNC